MNEALMKNDQGRSNSINGPQFGLLELFYVITVYAIGFVVSPWSLLWSTLVLLFWWLLIRRKATSVTGLVLVLSGLVILAILPASREVRVTYRRQGSLHNVRQLMLAIINWESGRREFPSAYSLDAEGNPKLSWRVHLLPQFGQKLLYDKFDLNEPWDGPTNRKLLNQMPQIFSSYETKAPSGYTPYKMVVDEGTVFEPGRSMNYGDVLDGSSNTVAVVEDANNPVPWTKPEDLTVAQAISVLGTEDPRDIKRRWIPWSKVKFVGSAVGLLDGSTHVIRPSCDPETIRRLCLVNDGLVVEAPDNSEIYLAARRVEQWQSNSRVGAYVFLLVIPGLVLCYRRLANGIGCRANNRTNGKT